MEPMNLHTKFCLLNWYHMRWSAAGTSITWILCIKHGSITSALFSEDKVGRRDLWAVNRLPRFTSALSSRDHLVTIWTNQSSADVLRLVTCANVKLIHVDCRDRKISMPPGLNTEVRHSKTEPIAAQLAILPPPYLCFSDVHLCRTEFWVV